MKRKYSVEIYMEIEGPEMDNFDPKIHQNYEFIHQNDDAVSQMIKNSFQMTLPKYSINAVEVGCRDAHVILNSFEAIKDKEFCEIESKKEKNEYEALDNLAKEHGISKAIWSVSHVGSESIPTYRFGMKVRFVSDDEYTEKYYSEVYENPTYLDAWKEFDNVIKHTGDFHHVFLESFVKLQTIDGVTFIGFSSGS